ncbi:MAG: S41 family peptidase [Bacteroidota bacterium]
MRIVAILLLLLIQIVSKAQDAGIKNLPVYSSQQVRADFIYLKNLLEKVHPSLYRYTTKDTLDHYFDSGFSKLDHPMDQIEAWLLMQSVVAKIKSLHTYLTLSASFLNERSINSLNVIPFYICKGPDISTGYPYQKGYFIKNYIGTPDTSIRLMSKILEIDGEPIEQIVDKLKTLISADGNTDSYKENILETGSFNNLYALLYPQKNEFTFLFKSFDGVKKKQLVKAANIQGTRKFLINGFKSRIAESDSMHFNYHSSDSIWHTVIYPRDIPSTAWVMLNSFTYNDYEKFHDKLFRDLKNKEIKNLIIDLRGNHGGYDRIAIDLLKYLINKRFYYTKEIERVVDVNDFTLVMKTEKHTIDDPSLLLSLIDHKFYKGNFSIYDGLQKSYKKTFKGNVYLLTDGGTCSAGSLFSVAMKSQNNCKVWGKETGGTQAGSDGYSFNIVLPHTSLELTLPLIWSLSASTEYDYGRGLKPDQEIFSGSMDLTFIMMQGAVMNK